MTRDPRKTTGLIGRTCKSRNALSEPVLMVNDLVVPTGFRLLILRRHIRVAHPANQTSIISCSSAVFDDIHVMTNHPPASRENAMPDLSVTISPGRHLIPSRTQKLSLGCR